VSKEQNTLVQVGGEGSIELKMRVFVANSAEARAVSDYISSHSYQARLHAHCLPASTPLDIAFSHSLGRLGTLCVASFISILVIVHALRVR
jgi:hypothetical protein